MCTCFALAASPLPLQTLLTPVRSEYQELSETRDTELPQRLSFGGVITPQEGWSVSVVTPRNLSPEEN